MNFGTAIVLLVLVAAVVLTVRRLRWDKKAGRCACGCSCAACAMADKCHSNKK